MPQVLWREGRAGRWLDTMRDDDREGVRGEVRQLAWLRLMRRALLTHLEDDLDHFRIELSLERNVFWRGARAGGSNSTHSSGCSRSQSHTVTDSNDGRRFSSFCYVPEYFPSSSSSSDSSSCSNAQMNHDTFATASYDARSRFR